MRERNERMEIQETISKELLTLLIELCTHQEIDIELYKNLTDKEKEIFDILNEETMGGFGGNLSKVETGERNLKLTEILKLSSLYMVSEEYILYGEGEPGKQFFVKDNKKIRLETIQRMNKICSNLLEMSELYEKHYEELRK